MLRTRRPLATLPSSRANQGTNSTVKGLAEGGGGAGVAQPHDAPMAQAGLVATAPDTSLVVKGGFWPNGSYLCYTPQHIPDANMFVRCKTSEAHALIFLGCARFDPSDKTHQTNLTF